MPPGHMNTRGRFVFLGAWGTRQERRAARYIFHQFNLLGLRRRRERFSVSCLGAELNNVLVLSLAACLAVIGALSAPAYPIVGTICWASAGLAIYSPWCPRKLFQARWGPCSFTSNLVASLPDSPTTAPARVVFMAHYDTKSQLFPTAARVAIVSAALLLCGLLTVLELLAALGFVQSLGWAIPAGAACMIVILVLALMVYRSGNRSPGALDNGSAVGTLLELARTWRPKSGAPIEAVWVASGSEEVDLNGSRHFLKLHQSWWHEKPTLLINLESVGAGSRLYLAGEEGSLRLAQQIARRLSIPHRRLRVVGAAMDHEPFAARQLPSLSILGDVVSNSFAMHSSRDNMSLIEASALERAGTLAGHIAWSWAEIHQQA